jgi:glycerophosphoryl diester phosphodiesterase
MRTYSAFFVLITLLAFTGCQTTFEAGAPAGSVDVIAHRGASAYTPENTLAAFALAHRMRADWFELDCTLSKDGEVIVIHDGTVKRTAGVDRPVAEMTLAELKSLDAGSWFSPEYAGERLPTLGESLDFARGRIGVYIEVKNSDDDRLLIASLVAATAGETALTPELQAALMTQVEESGTRNLTLARRVINEVRAREMERQIVVQSFSPVICLVVLSEAPELRVELLGSEDKDDPGHWPRLVHIAKLFRVDGFNAHHESLSPERISDFHANGMTVAAWTVDEPAVMAQLVDWGVDALITNKPDLCRAVLEGRTTDSAGAVNPAAVGGMAVTP